MSKTQCFSHSAGQAASTEEMDGPRNGLGPFFRLARTLRYSSKGMPRCLSEEIFNQDLSVDVKDAAALFCRSGVPVNI